MYIYIYMHIHTCVDAVSVQMDSQKCRCFNFRPMISMQNWIRIVSRHRFLCGIWCTQDNSRTDLNIFEHCSFCAKSPNQCLTLDWSPLRSLKACLRDGFFICWKNELDHLCSRSAAYLFHFVSVANAKLLLNSQDGGDVQFDRFDNTSGILYLRMIGQKLRLPLVRDSFENAL